MRFISRPFGGLFIGAFADKYGRRSALIFTSALTGFATLGMALLPTYEMIGIAAPCLLFLMQLLQAFCFGGASPVALAYLYEEANEREYTRIGAMLWGATFLSIALSLLIVLGVDLCLSDEEMQSYGWRIPVFLGTVNILISYYFRSKLIESKQFVRSKSMAIPWRAALKVFLLYVPCSILFYSNSLSSHYMIEAFTSDPQVKMMLPIVFNVIFFVASLVLCHFIDQHFCRKRVLHYTYVCRIHCQHHPLRAVRCLWSSKSNRCDWFRD